MPSIALEDVSHSDYRYKLDEFLIEILIVHGREWFNWRHIGGTSAWYWSAVKHGYLKAHPDKLSVFRLTGKAMEYIRQLGEDNEITQNNQHIRTSEAQGDTPNESSTTPLADWVA